MISLAIFGASGFGREVLPIVRRDLPASSELEIVFVDDRPTNGHLNGCAVLSYGAWIARERLRRRVIVAVGDGRVRAQLVARCESDGIEIADVRASTAIVMDEVQIGPGAVLCDHVILTSNIQIGRGFQANLYSYVGHDCRIGDFVTFAPAVKCNGNVVIEDHAYIGAGAVIKQGRPGRPLVIGQGAVVGMGAVVTRDVPAGTTVVGNPARPLVRRAADSDADLESPRC